MALALQEKASANSCELDRVPRTLCAERTDNGIHGVILSQEHIMNYAHSAQEWQVQ